MVLQSNRDGASRRGAEDIVLLFPEARAACTRSVVFEEVAPFDVKGRIDNRLNITRSQHYISQKNLDGTLSLQRKVKRTVFLIYDSDWRRALLESVSRGD
jgi:hypothetical protein